MTTLSQGQLTNGSKKESIQGRTSKEQSSPTSIAALESEGHGENTECSQGNSSYQALTQGGSSRMKIWHEKLRPDEGRTSRWRSRPKMIELDGDRNFSFIGTLPSYEEFFDKQLMLHATTSPSEQRIILRSTGLGKTFHPVCTVVRRNSDTGQTEEMCHFARPLHTDEAVNYIVGFQATNQRSAQFATLIWLVLSTFGLYSRKSVSLRWMSTPTLDAEQGIPTLEFINALNHGVEALHGFVTIRGQGVPRFRKEIMKLVIRKYKIFGSEEEAENFLKSTDQSNLIGAADKHDYEKSPYFNDSLREFIKLSSNRKDAIVMYNYVHLQQMWAIPNAETPDQLEEILQPSTRRAWPVQGFITDPHKAADQGMPSVIQRKRKSVL